MKRIIFSIVLFVVASCNSRDRQDENNEGGGETIIATPVINYAVTNVYPHDTTAFTEGLLVHDGQLYESTGSPPELSQTKSLFGPVDLTTGIINKKVELDKQLYFGEGIVFLGRNVYQLTYQNMKGFIYDAKTFQKRGEFMYPSKEGWGLTTDSNSLIMSDGTSNLTYLNPTTFKPGKSLQVNDESGSVSNLNELEFIGDALYANVYTTSLIVRIDTSTGKVTGKLDLSSLVNEVKVKYPPSLEMNGIAYNPANRKIYVTGKMWPNIYEISFKH